MTPSLLCAAWQEAKTASESRDKAHQEQIGALSRDLQRVSRHFTESQEYSTFLEGKLEEGISPFLNQTTKQLFAC